MTKKTGYIFLAIWGILLVGYGCRQQQKVASTSLPTGRMAENTFTINGSVREMNISPETPEFPEHEGKSEFMSYCSMCHSLKYITMQPDFPRKTWEAEVAKMVVKYKAPIDSVVSKKIVDYLVAVKSKH